MIRIRLPFKVREPILACGADMKGAFGLAKGEDAYLADGFGDLSNPDCFARYEKAIRRCRAELGITPRVIACDLHPGYFSGRLAERYSLMSKRCKLCKVQHHEAHIASAVADNAIKGDVIGVAFDGTGFGSDGNIWGGEFFIGNLRGFKRTAHFEYMPMPGGEAAVREPWRMGTSYLYRAFGSRFIDLKIGFTKGINRKRWLVLKAMIDKKINSPLTSSVGRLFDAIGSIVLSKNTVETEAELPVELEKAAAGPFEGHYDFDIDSKKGATVINCARTVRAVVKDLSRGAATSVISGRFHNTVAAMIVETSLILRKKIRIKRVVLSGGVFQNRFLCERALAMLREKGFDTYVHSKVPVNDYGIPMGQIAIANARAVCV